MPSDMLSEYALWLNQDSKTRMSGITTVEGCRASKKQLTEIVYWGGTLVLRYPVDSIGRLTAEQSYTIPSGSLTVEELFNILITFYNSPHSRGEVKTMKKLARRQRLVVLNGALGHPRSHYLPNPVFSKLKRVGATVYDVLFSD